VQTAGANDIRVVSRYTMELILISHAQCRQLRPDYHPILLVDLLSIISSIKKRITSGISL
jgi:hypothetical protein